MVAKKPILKISWDEVINDSHTLASSIDDTPDCIVTLGRGGMIPGTIIAYRLGIRKIYNYGVHSYNDDNEPSHVRVYQEPDFNELTDKKVLVIDDLSDTGATIEYVNKHLINNKCSVCVGTLYIKKDTKLKPQYYVREFCSNTWLNFPWDSA